MKLNIINLLGGFLFTILGVIFLLIGKSLYGTDGVLIWAFGMIFGIGIDLLSKSLYKKVPKPKQNNKGNEQ